MKIKIVSYCAMMATLLFAACQQEEVKPAATAAEEPLVDEQADGRSHGNARYLDLIAVRYQPYENGCTNTYRAQAIGKDNVNWCYTAADLAVKWHIRFHDAAGNVTSQSVVWDYNEYECIEENTVYASTGWLTLTGPGQTHRVSFYARFYRRTAPGDSYASRYTGYEADTGIVPTPHFQYCGG